MSHLTELKKNLYDYQTAEVTARSLQDINAIREQSIRRAFEKNNSFYEEIRRLYRIVQTQTRSMGSQKAKSTDRVLMVAITSNKHFFGSLIRLVIETFIAELRRTPKAEGIVVGSVGWQYYEQLAESGSAKYVPFENDEPTPDELQSLFKRFEGFDRVYVLHPKFINAFKQDVAIEDIMQTASDLPNHTAKAVDTTPPGAKAAAVVSAEQASEYIFEPEAPAILAFFDSQVRRILLGRVMLESELARTAARLMRMSEAQERAQTLVGSAEKNISHETAALSNMELLETFAGFASWKNND